jgi:serine/threonine protein kinase/DNA-binding CsgD family transcriptional regulator
VNAANDLVSEAEARIGAVLGRWRIARLIGIGGMGAVYEAQDGHTRVALKVLHRRAAISEEQIARFRREGHAANRVSHSGVVEVFDHGVDEQGFAFFVMELLSGRTAAELAGENGGKLPLGTVLELAERVVEVLAAAHAKGILHRDIKPENVFITEGGQIKVLDFGIAKLSDSESVDFRTADGTLLGTPAFSSPEQARGRVDEIDERSDVWAVGATMFALLSGRPVHVAETTNEQLGLAMSVNAPPLASVEPDIPPLIAALVDKALAYEQRDRWPSASAMQVAIRTARQALATGAREVPAEWITPPNSKHEETWPDRRVSARVTLQPDLVGMIEAIYRFDQDTSSWLEGILERLRPWLDDGMGLFGFDYLISPEGALVPSSFTTVACPSNLFELLPHPHTLHDPDFIRHSYLTRDATAASEIPGWRQCLPAAYAEGHGILDSWGINGRNPGGRGTVILVNRRREKAPEPGLRAVFVRIAAHLAAAHRLRERLRSSSALDRAEAVLAPDGSIEHASGDAKAVRSLDVLRSAARLMDEARGKLRREAPNQALSQWRGLVDTRWTLFEHFDSDGRRFILAQENEPIRSSVAQLSSRERQVFANAALGRSNDEIAYALGIAPPAVQELLTFAMNKLGAHSRSDLGTRLEALTSAGDQAADVRKD